MTDCLSHDQLVDLLSVVDRPVSITLDHLASCPACREELAALEQVRELLRADLTLPAEFIDGVMGRIDEAAERAGITAGSVPAPAGDVAAHQRSPWKGRVQGAAASALAIVLSGVAAAVVLAAAGSSAPAGMDFTPAALLAGFLVGGGLAVQQLLSNDSENHRLMS